MSDVADAFRRSGHRNVARLLGMLDVWQALMRGFVTRLETEVQPADVEAFQVGDQCAYRFLEADGSRVSNLNAYAAMVTYYLAARAG